MKRWNCKLGRRVENPRVDLFLSDVIAVCVKHGFSLSHEDGHGAFVVEPINATANSILNEAVDETGKP